MSILYTWQLRSGVRCRLPERISFLQLEAVTEMLKAFCAIGDKYYEPVMEYVLKHKVYLVHGLQRVTTNLRENNQLVMMWYAERNYGETEEQQRAISLVSSFYQQLSLMSYAYEFTVAVWSVCCKQAVKDNHFSIFPMKRRRLAFGSHCMCSSSLASSSVSSPCSFFSFKLFTL